MGLLSEGKPLTWAETKEYVDLVKRTGVLQFISAYQRLKNRPRDELKWGDEIEYNLVAIDDKNKRTQLHLIGPDILLGLQVPESSDPDNHTTKWRPEYASYMIEGTPGATPYGGHAQHLNQVEANMVLRRRQLKEALKATSTIPLSVTAFPRIGCQKFTLPEVTLPPLPPASQSLFFPDEAIWSGHPRFITLTRNIRERREEKVAINIPIFKDEHTPSPFIEEFPTDLDGRGSVQAKPDHIYMDCMGFGMGCCCLQVTFQACDLQEGRLLYDQLAVVCPIMLSVSAATPVLRGYLSDLDCRWNVISSSVDDRTPEERGVKPLNKSPFTIPTSRYDTIDCYLSNGDYNDKPVLYDQKVLQTLIDGGVDDLLAQHVAHLFIRDPVSLFQEKIHQSTDEDTDHFENIQSTNWQSMRFKPPPPHSTIGWRIEFRPLEVQLTDFENAAFTVFVVLLTRAILSFKLNFIIPISKMQENMIRAQKRDAVHREKFYFRKSVVPDDDEDDTNEGVELCGSHDQSHDQEYTEMTIDTILNGKDEFPGLIPLVRMYVNSIDIDVDTRCTVMQYLRLISKKASGELMTTATWIRNFVTTHPHYKKDSVVTEEMTYDLVKRMQEISEGGEPCTELTGKLLSKTPEIYKVIDK